MIWKENNFYDSGRTLQYVSRLMMEEKKAQVVLENIKVDVWKAMQCLSVNICILFSVYPQRTRQTS